MTGVTQILASIERGDPHAAGQLLPLVYDELRKLAAARMANERPDHTLQPTALVHEAYVRLVDTDQAQHWNSRGHFFGAAAEAMRRILVDSARNKRRLKRGGEAQQISLDVVELIWEPQFGDILDLNEALDELESEAPDVAELVKLCCFAGQTQAEAAALMGVSPRTAKRWWAFARAWLFQHLRGSDSAIS